MEERLRSKPSETSETEVSEDILTEVNRNRQGDYVVHNGLMISIEVLEMLLIKMFVALVRHIRTKANVSEGERLAYRTLSGVCYEWWQTLHGWPQSNTKHWVRHRLQHLVTYLCHPYRHHPHFDKLDTKSNGVMGMTLMGNKFYICSESDTIGVFAPNNEHLEDIKVKELGQPCDIAADSTSGLLYIADREPPGCVWQVSTDGRAIKFSPPTASSFRPFRPVSLSVMSGRVLLTTFKVLFWYKADKAGADEAKVVELTFRFPNMSDFQHAIETAHGTIVFCHRWKQPQVVEVNDDGGIISVYNDPQQLACPWHLSLDFEGKVFIADLRKHRILLLTSKLEFNRVLLDTQHNQLVENPQRVLYLQQTRQLFTGNEWSPVLQVYII